LLGLEWKDIDFQNHIISVRRTSQYLPKRGIFTKGTKNDSSIRVLKLSDIVFDLLREYRQWQTEERLKVGSQWQTTDRLFTAWNGSPMHPDNLTGWFETFIKRTDLPYVSIHNLRHTNATLMIASGADIRTVSKRLGHAQTTTTLNIYSHAIQSADEAAAASLGNILDPMKHNSNIG
jgi:integrase